MREREKNDQRHSAPLPNLLSKKNYLLRNNDTSTIIRDNGTACPLLRGINQHIKRGKKGNGAEEEEEAERMERGVEGECYLSVSRALRSLYE